MARFILIVGMLLLIPASLAQPSGTLLVLNKADDTAWFLALPSGEKLGEQTTGRGPHEAAVSPDGRLAVAANFEDPAAPTLTVYDTASFDTVRTIDLGESRSPHGVAFVPGSGLLAVTCEGSGHLVLVDAASGQVAARIDTGARGSHMVAVTPDGARAFVANIPDGTVSAIDLGARTLLKIIPTGPGAEGIDITPDGREVWVANRSHSVSVIDAAALDLIETVECSGFPIRCKVTPDGARVLVSCAEAGEVAIFDRASRRESSRARVIEHREGEGLGPIGMVITPDGRHALVANSTRNEIAILDLETLEVLSRLPTGNIPDGLGLISPPRPRPGETEIAR